MALYDKIKELCKAKDIPVYKLESDAELASSSISKWNKSMPSADSLYRVAKLLGTTVESLLEE